MKMLRIAIVAASLAVLGFGTAEAQTASNQVTLSCTPPTTDTNGGALAPPITYKLYGALQGVTKQLLASGLTTCGAVRTNVTPGTQCYQMSANNVLGESDMSNEACKVVTAIPPGKPTPPTNLIATAAVVVGMNMAPVYQFNKAGGMTNSTLLGFMPVGQPCGQTVAFTYKGMTYRPVVDKTKVEFWGAAPSSSVQSFLASACSG